MTIVLKSLKSKTPKIIKTQQKGNNIMWQKALQLNGGGSTPFQFSTEEQKTNMKWIDGKDIYIV